MNGGGIYTSTDSGATWTLQSGSPTGAWSAIASSSDGTHLAATINGGVIYTSKDSGVTWTSQSGSPTGAWSAIASSSDGTHLDATIYGGGIYTSKDSGVTWTMVVGSNANWSSITTSANGANVYAGVYNGLIHSVIFNQTTIGASGSLAGSQGDAVTLQYIGNGTFIVLNYTSNSGSFTIQ